MMDALGFLQFDNLANFPVEYNEDKWFIYSHSLRWVLNSYRVREIIRKKVVYGLKEPFTYGIKC